MNHTSAAYLLAQELHETFRGESGLISESERAASGVQINNGHMTNTDQVIAWDEKEGVRFSQTLSLGRNGMYYFSTVYGYPDGRYERRTITENSGEDAVKVLAQSAFIKSFKRIISERD